MQEVPWWMVEESTHRLREVGMLKWAYTLKWVCYGGLRKPLFAKVMVAVLVQESPAVLRSSAMPLSVAQLTEGRDALSTLGSLMDLRLARSQNNKSQVPVLSFQKDHGHNWYKSWWIGVTFRGS